MSPQNIGVSTKDEERNQRVLKRVIQEESESRGLDTAIWLFASRRQGSWTAEAEMSKNP